MKYALLTTAVLLAIVAIAAGAVLATGNFRALIDSDYSATQPWESRSEATSRPHRSGEPSLADNVARLAGILDIGSRNDRVVANIASISPEDAVKRLGNLQTRKGDDFKLPPFNRKSGVNGST